MGKRCDAHGAFNQLYATPPTFFLRREKKKSHVPGSVTWSLLVDAVWLKRHKFVLGPVLPCSLALTTEVKRSNPAGRRRPHQPRCEALDIPLCAVFNPILVPNIVFDASIVIKDYWTSSSLSFVLFLLHRGHHTSDHLQTLLSIFS